ncbi:MAG: UbiA family prenyltransferase [Candidatus Nanopelagicus sp.]
MSLIFNLLKATHIGPTSAVTLISFLLASSLWWEGPAFIIAFSVFLGQLLVGFTNDLYDYPDDLKHNRNDKPLVSGEITTAQLKSAIKIVTPLAILVNLFGPLGIKGGLIYLLGVGLGISYNFYFKFTLLSPLPYALAFAALVAAIVVATDRTPPLWLLISAACLGVAAHFANVIKDINEDLKSEIIGLPQKIGKKASRVVIGILLIGTTILLNFVTPSLLLLSIGLVAAVFTIFASDKLIFKALIITVIVDLILILTAADSQIGSLVI